MLTSMQQEKVLHQKGSQLKSRSINKDNRHQNLIIIFSEHIFYKALIDVEDGIKINEYPITYDMP